MTDSNPELPVLTEIVDDSPLLDLPILFEIIAEADDEYLPPPAEIKPPPPRPLNGEEISHLLQQLESHLETVFTEKLNKHLEELQHLAIDLAVSEFKAELPQLLRDALSNTASSK